MEWPKHYTSEKVLTLMTYTELMNRSQGTQTTSQIRPVRFVLQVFLLHMLHAVFRTLADSLIQT